MSNDLILLETFTTRLDADVRRTFLEANDIEVFITADDAGGARPFPFSPTTEGVQLFIQEKDLKKAKELYKTIKK